MACACEDGYYKDGNACSSCNSITNEDDPLLQFTDPLHLEGVCDCVDNAEWDEDSHTCLCSDGFYTLDTICADCTAITLDDDPLIETVSPNHANG